MKLSALLSVLTEYRTKNLTNSELEKIEIVGLCMNSKEVKKGDLFFCLNGSKNDGHNFVQTAEELGASVIVCERELESTLLQIIVKDTRSALAILSAQFYENPTQKMQVVGITGTNGKTTTANMLAEIIKSAGKKVGVIGTLGTFYENNFLPPSLTTPDPIFLQKILADMQKRGVEYVVMEVSAHALYFKKTLGIRFVATIFSNLTQDHLDFFASMKEYKKAKLELFKPKLSPISIVNADDFVSKEISSLRKTSDEKGLTKTFFYSLKNPSDAFAVITDECLKNINFILNINDELASVSLKLIGTHNVYNALSAGVCARALGFSMKEVENGLNAVRHVRGRLEWIGEYNGGDIFVDFAHTPDGLEKSLRSLKKLCVGRLVCVFGCGGNRDREKRAIMGEKASSFSDFCYLTSDNPRDEEPMAIIKDIEKGISKKFFDYVVISERSKAITVAMNSLKKGDVLIVAGKGGEDYQEIKGIKIPYKDEDLIREIIEKV